MKKVTIKLNGKKVLCSANETVLAVAKRQGIDIPALCQHDDFPPKANCRVCVVEIKGRHSLQTSCSTVVEEGMEVITDSPRVEQARKTNIELIYAEHIEKCADCVWRFECKLLDFARKYKLKISRYKDRKASRPTYKFANAVELDGSQCIDCRNCVTACSLLQNINYLEIKGKGVNQEIVPTKNKDIHCILCGQCAVHCPVSAAQEQAQWDKVEAEIKDKNKIVIAQFAPSIRVSIGEDFGMAHGEVVTGQLVAALRELGFDYVFDVNFGADITTIVEAEELVARLTKKDKPLPMMTSCCPAWVNYVEFYHPELIPNLTTARSPHIHSAGVIKTYWANKMKIDVKKLVVVSVMPCTAKKYEAVRPELKIDGNFPVDYSITTRELSFMLKKKYIDLKKLKSAQADNPLGEYSGAAAIYGGSGGVMESALRTAQSFACENKTGPCQEKIEFKEVRGLAEVKEATVDVAGNELKVAVVNGIGHIEQVLEKLQAYDYIEVMACPGGCIGGGGQPIPTTPEIRQKRIDALYKIDKKMLARKAHENKAAMQAVGWLKGKGRDIEHKVLHTRYKKKTKY